MKKLLFLISFFYISLAIFPQNTNTEEIKTDNLGIMLNINADFYFNNSAFSAAHALSASLVLGGKNVANQNIFLGAGVSYESIFLKNEKVNLLPVFLRIQKPFSNRKISPYASLDLGYSLIQNENWKGGFLTRATGGVVVDLKRNKLFLGVSVALQSCETTLYEVRNNQTYIYNGNTILNKIGLIASVLF